MQRLARDVGVNVVANLIAGAIIYLGGVYATLFQSNTVAIAFAVFILGSAVLGVLLGGVLKTSYIPPIVFGALSIYCFVDVIYQVVRVAPITGLRNATILTATLAVVICVPLTWWTFVRARRARSPEAVTPDADHA